MNDYDLQCDQIGWHSRSVKVKIILNGQYLRLQLTTPGVFVKYSYIDAAYFTNITGRRS